MASQPRVRFGGVATQDRGSELVEFALILPFLCVILFGAIDFGRVSYQAMALTNAARAGAQYGAQSIGKSSDVAGMRAAALSSASSDIGGITATASQRCECNGALIACTATCSSARRVYVTVTTTRTFTTLTRFPGFPNSLTLTRSAVIRAQ